MLTVFLLNPFFTVLFTTFLAYHRKKDHLLLILIGCLACFMGVLNTTKLPESDLLAYKNIFLAANDYNIHEYLNLFKREYVYYFLSYLFYYLTGGNWSFFLFTVTLIAYALILISVRLVLKILDTDKTTSVFVLVSVSMFPFLFTLSAHLLRNFLAGSCVVYFLVNFFFLNKNKLQWLIIAVLIHSSALLFVLVYFLFMENIKTFLKKRLLVLVFFLLLLFWFVVNQGDYIFIRIRDFFKASDEFKFTDVYVFIIILVFWVYVYLRGICFFNIDAAILGLQRFSLLGLLLLFLVLVSLPYGTLIAQRLLLYLFLILAVIIAFYLSITTKYSFLKKVFFTLLMVVSFFYNYNFGVWEYEGLSSIMSKSVFSFF